MTCVTDMARLALINQALASESGNSQIARFLASVEDPVLDLARQIGIARLSQDARDYLEACIDWCDD